jgi:hypothetical protein
MGEQPIPQTAPVMPPTDAGLRCPQCDYNLTGLADPRCPECGEAFDWEQVRRAAANPPRIYFEHVRGWRKVPGFFVTWATVLFAPWVFARQGVGRISVVHAPLFACICFGGTFASMLSAGSTFPGIGSGADLAFVLTWLTTAVVYIAAQAVLLGILDFSGWRQPLRSLRFWLLVGCYTSAIMLTEVAYGPVQMGVSTLWKLPRELVAGPWRFDQMVPLAEALIWLAGLVCCYTARLRRTRLPRVIIVAAAVLTGLCILELYGVVYEYIGMHLYDWYDQRV